MTFLPWVGRHIGVEMEMNEVDTSGVNISEDSIRRAVSAGVVHAGGSARRVGTRGGYFHSNGTVWDIKTDASCGYNRREGWEVASPKLLLTDDAECPELKAVCAKLNDLKPRIDRKCGLHIHVDLSDFTWTDYRNLLILWARYEPFFFELCPPSRKASHYCQPIRKNAWGGGEGGHWTRVEQSINANNERALNGLHVDRFSAVNLEHFWRSHRIEFRLAAGTISYEKIVRWAQLLLTLVERAKTLGRAGFLRSGGWSDKGFTVGYMAKMLSLTPTKSMPVEELTPAHARLVRWMDARRALFADRPDADDTST